VCVRDVAENLVAYFDQSSGVIPDNTCPKGDVEFLNVGCNEVRNGEDHRLNGERIIEWR